MLVKNGAEKLRKFSQEQHDYQIFSPNKNLIHVVGLGHSNAGAIAGEHSVILIDTLDSVSRAKKLKKLLINNFISLLKLLFIHTGIQIIAVEQGYLKTL